MSTVNELIVSCMDVHVTVAHTLLQMCGACDKEHENYLRTRAHASPCHSSHSARTRDARQIDTPHFFSASYFSLFQRMSGCSLSAQGTSEGGSATPASAETAAHNG